MKQMTMKEIAEIANVGKATVSRYFNGGYVKESTREKIKKVIDEYNYTPNPVAQALKAKHSYQVAIISPTLESVTSGRVITAIDEQLRSLGYSSLILNTNHNLERELMSLLTLSRMNVEGVIILATTITQDHIELVSKLTIPVLFVAQKSTQFPYITLNDYQAGYQLGQYIVSMGHHHASYIGVGEEDVQVGIERKKGVFQAFKDTGLDEPAFVKTDFTFETSANVLQNYLPTCKSSVLICATDNIALAAYKQCHQLGLKIPDDLSICGFGGYEVSQIVQPELCTIRFDYSHEGQIAANYMAKLIQLAPFPKEEVDFKLIQGHSIKKL